jgi:hypothetical protein
METVNVIQCPHCGSKIEPWDYIKQEIWKAIFQWIVKSVERLLQLALRQMLGLAQVRNSTICVTKEGYNDGTA